MAFAIDGDLTLCHGLKQSALGSRGGSIQFIGEEKVRENGARSEIEFTGLLVEDAEACNLGRH